MTANTPLVIKTGKECGSPKQVSKCGAPLSLLSPLRLTLQADVVDNNLVVDESFCSPAYPPSWAQDRFLAGQGPLVIKTGKEFGTPKQVSDMRLLSAFALANSDLLGRGFCSDAFGELCEWILHPVQHQALRCVFHGVPA
jgi:hypothetical protein